MHAFSMYMYFINLSKTVFILMKNDIFYSQYVYMSHGNMFKCVIPLTYCWGGWYFSCNHRLGQPVVPDIKKHYILL